jgi:hypothetical protein
MSNEVTKSAASDGSGGKDKARRDFIGRFHQTAPAERLSRKAQKQLDRIFKHTAAHAIDIGEIDWLENDTETRQKKKFYLGCVKEVAEEAIVIAGSGMIDKDELLAASDKVVRKYEPTCSALRERHIFCLDYNAMPRD